MPYRDHPDMVVLSGVDDVQIALEESLVTVSTIKGSRFVAPIQVSLKKAGGGPTPFLYMATRFLPNVHVQNVQKCTKMYKIGFFMFGSSLDRFTCFG